MGESRVDNIESFINDLVSKLVLKAMDILDLNSEDADSYWRQIHVNSSLQDCEKCNDRKSRNFSLRVAQQRYYRVEKSFSCQGDHEHSSELSDFSRTLHSTDIRVHDHNLTQFDVDQSASEEIRKIVQGLRGIQIGDSSLVQPVTKVPSLVMQVKRAIQDVSNVPEISEIIEVSSTEGQGDIGGQDFHKNLPAAVVKVVDDQMKNSSPEKLEVLKKNNDEGNRHLQQQLQHHLQEQEQTVSKLRSACFLHPIIKEPMSSEATQKNAMKVSRSISAVSKEDIAAWEEREEKFIRIIESSKEESLENEADDSFPIFLLEEIPAEFIVEVEIEEMDSKPMLPMVPPPSLPSTRALPLPPTYSSPGLDDKQKTMVLQRRETDFKKSKKKIRVGEWLRRFFRSAFKRGKDS